MASQIETILDQIALWTPVYDTEAVSVWNIDDVRPNLEPMQVPRRVLGLADDTEFGFIAISGQTSPRSNIIWQVLDTLYIAPVAEMASLRRHHGDVIRYAASYAAQAQANRGLGSPKLAHVVSVQFSIGTFAYPPGSEILFHGVEAELEIQEVI